MKIGYLIEVLEKKDRSKEVEAIIIDSDGMIVVLDVNASADDMRKTLEAFGVRTK